MVGPYYHQKWQRRQFTSSSRDQYLLCDKHINPRPPSFLVRACMCIFGWRERVRQRVGRKFPLMLASYITLLIVKNRNTQFTLQKQYSDNAKQRISSVLSEKSDKQSLTDTILVLSRKVSSNNAQFTTHIRIPLSALY